MTTIKPGHIGGSPIHSDAELPSAKRSAGAPIAPTKPSTLDSLDTTKAERGVHSPTPGGLKEGLHPPKSQPLSAPPTFEAVPDIPSSLEAPGRIKGLIRGTKHENVFGPSKHWAGKHAVRLGNNLTKAIHRALDKLVHDEKKVELNLAEMGPADLDLAIRGKLLRERDQKAMTHVRKPSTLLFETIPILFLSGLSFGIDPTLKATLDPSLTLPGGALLKLGITAEAGEDLLTTASHPYEG